MAATVDKAQWDLAISAAKQNLDDAVLAHQKAALKRAKAQKDEEQAATALIEAQQTVMTLSQAYKSMFGEVQTP